MPIFFYGCNSLLPQPIFGCHMLVPRKNSVASNLSCHAYLFHCTRMFQRSTFYCRNNLAPQFFCMLREVFDATKLSFVEIEYHHKKFTLSPELLVTNILPVAINIWRHQTIFCSNRVSPRKV